MGGLPTEIQARNDVLGNLTDMFGLAVAKVAFEDLSNPLDRVSHFGVLLPLTRTR